MPYGKVQTTRAGLQRATVSVLRGMVKRGHWQLLPLGRPSRAEAVSSGRETDRLNQGLLKLPCRKWRFRVSPSIGGPQRPSCVRTSSSKPPAWSKPEWWGTDERPPALIPVLLLPRADVRRDARHEIDNPIVQPDQSGNPSSCRVGETQPMRRREAQTVSEEMLGPIAEITGSSCRTDH
jgi:hypothetical protein